MRHENQPLYAVAVAVLVAGLVVGLTFTGLSDSTVLVGVAILACLIILLFMLSRRGHLDEHDHHPAPGRRQAPPHFRP